MEQSNNLHVGLVGAFDSEAEVVSLGLAEGAELSLDVVEVKTGNLLVEDLGQNVDTNLELAGLGELDVLLAESLVVGLEQHDLGKDLVGEGAGHDEGRVTSGTTKVDETTLSEEDDVTSVLHQEAVNLGLDVLDRLGVGLDPSNVNLDIEVANVCETQRTLMACYSTVGDTFENLLQTMASLGIASKWTPVKMSRQPVVVTKI